MLNFTEDLGLGHLLTQPYSRVKPVPHLRDIEVRRNDIRLGKMLGEGHFGEVWEGQLHDKMPVAVKVLKEGSMTKESFMSEARIMNKLRHRRLVQLLAVCTEREQTLIVMEFLAKGPLLSYLKGNTCSFQDYATISLQIAEGMAFLETQNYIHRDLRAANVLVGEDDDVKVADFGLARVLTDEQIYTMSQSTPLPVKWTAPEALKSQNFSSKSDVWSYGVLLYEIITDGRDPYPGMTGPEIVSEVGNGYQMAKPNVSEDVLNTFYPIMQACWNLAPNKRPTFVALHQHLFNISQQLT
ncbi:tyrosine-protein kinase FRK-like [Haliotis rubra]|uniref:tyrosine-protein kinase FRK-like n=1 Tax=Haliotis rubra TaxID=36100 RepID=UPI001EE5083D|nr:tyrosine-protein kinase FRK-like [Haliotis rubra]